jgi:cytochrome c-type biogenesis protein CcmH
MISFYIGSALLIVLAAVFALWPLIKNIFKQNAGVSEDVQRQRVNVALYEDHLTDLKNSLNQGNISQAQFDELKLELEKNLLEDSEHAEQKSNARNYKVENAKLYIGVIVIAIPLMAVALYYSLGNKTGWELKSVIEEQRQLEHQLMTQGANTDIEEQLFNLNRDLVQKLEGHVAKHPEDLESKVLLARNAMGVGQYDKAINNYQQIIEAEPEAAQMIAELAQAVFIKADNRAVPVVGMLAQRALAIQPNNLMALGTLGLFHYQSGQFRDAIKAWQRAVNLYPPESPNARALQNGITRAQAQLSIEAGQTTDGETASAQQPKSEGEAVSSELAPSRIKVAVSISEDVTFKPTDTVFIYARAWQGAKIPLAILRINASQLPLTVELNDSMAMAPGMTLSSADQVEVIARLSPSGEAIAKEGDWQASLGPVASKSSAETVYPLIISKPYKP